MNNKGTNFDKQMIRSKKNFDVIRTNNGATYTSFNGLSQLSEHSGAAQ